VSPDSDGTLRRVPLLMEYPSLALAAAQQSGGTRLKAVSATSDYPLTLTLDDERIPLDAEGRLLLGFLSRTLSN
jgi:hypothetical protein